MTHEARPLEKARLWTIGIVACALLVLGGVCFVRRAAALEPEVGVRFVQTSEGPLVLHVEPNGAGAVAGLLAGDLLTEIDGRRVTSALVAAQLGWDERSEIRLRVRRGAGTFEALLAPDRRAHEEPYGYLALVGLAFWASGVFIAVRWPGVRGAKVYVTLAGTLYLALVLSDTGRADRFDWIIYWLDLGARAAAPALLLHMGVALTKRTLPLRKLVLGMAYALSALLVLAAVWLAVGGALRFDDPSAAIETRDRLESLVFGLSLLLTGVVLVRSYSRSASAMHRSQARWLLWGLGLGLGPFVFFYYVPWALGADDLPAWAQFLSVLPMLSVPAAFSAALARYRLHDLDLLLVRGVSEVAAVFSTFAVLAAAIFLLREGVSGWLPISRGGARYLGFLVAAVAYPTLRSIVRAGVERAFYRKRYSYRATLLDWARELSAETDLPSLVAHLTERVQQTLGVPRAEVLLLTGAGRCESPAHAAEAGLALGPPLLLQLEKGSCVVLEEDAPPALAWARYLFAMRVKGRLRALLAVAEREPPLEPLSSEDRALLGTLAAHAGTAIEAARLVLEVRRRAEEIERLHAREARILESSAVGLLLLDGPGRVLAWNRALEEISGTAREQAIGCRIEEVLPLHVVRRIAHAEGASAGTRSRVFRLALVNRKDERRVVNIAVSPADDGGSVISFDDVTSRVKLEEQVLQQERLAALGLLAAGVAHEINTPLTGISSYTQLLLEERHEQDRDRDVLEKIEVQARRASSIANSLLDMARPERAGFQPLDLNETVLEVLRLFEPQLLGRDIGVEARLAEGLPAVRGHKAKLQQVLLNLLANARDALRSEGTVRISTRARNGMAVLEVADDGAGIAEEDLPRIFDPFFTTKGRRNGSGLGLSISYGIVQEHAGQIHVDSSLGRGTRFEVELPLALTVRAAMGTS